MSLSKICNDCKINPVRMGSKTKCIECSYKNYGRYDKYGITYQEGKLLESYDGGYCSICKIEIATSIDHDHASGLVRGALCKSCNWALGHFKDSVQILSNAIEYLEYPPARKLGIPGIVRKTPLNSKGLKDV